MLLDFDKVWNNVRPVWGAAVIILALSVLPYFLLGQDAAIMVWDNLDSNLVLWKVLLESGVAFGSGDAMIPNLLMDLPRALYPSELSAFTILFSVFGYFWGYVANRVLQTLVGFWGMRLLLGRHFLTRPEDLPIVLGVAVAFAVLPHWPFGGLSVAGLPLVFAAFLSIRSGSASWRDWCVLALFPLYSNLVLVGLFLAPVLLAIIVFDAFRRQRFVAPLTGLALLTAVYIFVEYRLFLFTFGPSGFISHRTEFADQPTGLGGALSEIISIGINGQAHAQSLHGRIILPTVLAGAPTLLWLRKELPTRTLAVVVLFLAVTIIWYGVVSSGLASSLTNLSPVQLQRFHFLHPVAWYVLFAAVLTAFTRASQLARGSVIVLIALQVLVNARSHEILLNRNGPSFAEFFAVDQFEEIEAAIGRPKDSYRVASLGLDPMVAAFNGFHTVDGYLANYPLEYKHAFAEVIRGEMDSSPAIAQYFGNWGSRVYLFSAELSQGGRFRLVFKEIASPLSLLRINKDALRKLGVEYIFSAVPLSPPAIRGLELIGQFDSSVSAWRIHVYRLTSS